MKLRKGPQAGQRGGLTSGLTFAVSSFGVTAALALVSSVMLGRLFGVQIVGEVALVLAPQGVMVFLSTFQEQPVLIRRLATIEPRDPRATGLFVVSFAFSAALSLAVGLLVAGAAVAAFRGPIDRPDLVAPALVGLAAYVVVWNTLWNLDSVFSAFHDGRTLFRVRTHQSLVYVVALPVGAAISLSVWTVVVVTVLSWTTALIHRLFLLPRWLTLTGWRATLPEARSLVPEIVGFGLRLSPGSIAAGISAEAGTWLLGALSTVPDVGSYNRASSLTKRLSEVTWRISEMVLPALVQRRASGDREGEALVFAGALRLGVVGMTFAGCVGAGAAGPLMAMFGPGFSAGAPALALLFFVPLTWQVITLQTDVLISHGRPGAITAMTIPTSIATVGITYLMIDSWGATGAAAGLLSGGVLRVIVGQAVVARLTGVAAGDRWPWRERLGLVVAGGAAYGAGLGAVSVLGASVATIVPTLLAGALVGAGVGVALGVVTSDDVRRVRAARG